ncbi:MAG TPA: type IX secretion system membrane protein PorP/SprF [Bacteroidales bacterium]|nr:type IX secretion system membrane protein PorP/SprF [Bacteroidales bacterium]
MKAVAKRYIILIEAALLTSIASAQQLPLYSQYLYNKFLINPAVAGSDGYTSLNLTAREQWVGYSGAPRTFSFSAQTRMMKKSFILKQTRLKREVYRPSTDGKVGLGGYIFSDKNGLVQRTGFQFSYAYHTWLRNSTQLSFGLAVTGYHYKIDDQQIDFEDPNEPWMNNNLRKGMFVPDATFGVYLLNAKYSVGFSADQLFEASARIASNAYQNFRVNRHYYLFGSYDFEPAYKTIIQPSLLLMSSELIMPQLDIGATYIYDNHFWAGLALRTSGAIIANIGVKHEKMFFGYAFDFTLQQLQRVTYGTHEITIACKFGDSSRRYRWLDRY